MDPLTIAGLALQGGSLLGQALGPSEADRREADRARRQRAVDEAVARFMAMKRAAITEGVNRIGKQASGMVASSRSAAMQRAAAAGRSGEAESYVLPAEAKMGEIGNEALTNFVGDTNRTYDTAAMNAQLTGLSQDVQPLPETPNWTDYGMELGGGLTRYGLSQPKTTPSTTTTVPTTPMVSPQDMLGDIPPEPLPENPPEAGAFQIPSTTSRLVDFSSGNNFTQPETDYRSLQYNPRLRMSRGLRRASIF